MYGLRSINGGGAIVRSCLEKLKYFLLGLPKGSPIA